jgi:crossover junction endodeoxyribonuclease RuvC
VATGARLAGLDLSLTSTGFARICGGDVALARIRPVKRDGHVRLEFVAAEIAALVDDADLVAVEGPSYGSQAGQQGHHERAGLWWLVTHMLWRQGIPYVVVAPSGVKRYATGSGGGLKAGKDQVLAAVIRRYPEVPVDGNDQADALVLAAMAADYYGQPLAPVPEAHRTALAGVKGWPDVLPRAPGRGRTLLRHDLPVLTEPMEAAWPSPPC